MHINADSMNVPLTNFIFRRFSDYFTFMATATGQSVLNSSIEIFIDDISDFIYPANS